MSFSVLAMQNFIFLYLNPTKSEITSHKNVFKLVCQTCIKNNKSERKKHYYLSHIKQVLYRVLLHTVFPISSGERHFFEFKSLIIFFFFQTDLRMLADIQHARD